MKKLCLALAISLLSSVCSAEDIRISVGDQGDDPLIQKPKRGLDISAVERKFGSPISKHGPVGQPPIHYWEYENFTVYFEHNHVIHAVAKFKSNEALKK